MRTSCGQWLQPVLRSAHQALAFVPTRSRCEAPCPIGRVTKHRSTASTLGVLWTMRLLVCCFSFQAPCPAGCCGFFGDSFQGWSAVTISGQKSPQEAGNKSLRVMAPPVNRSMATACTMGTERLLVTHSETTGGLIPRCSASLTRRPATALSHSINLSMRQS
jgi:hypothetical protein